MNGLHLVQVNEYDQMVILRKPKRKTYELLISKHSVVLGYLSMRGKKSG